MTLPKSRKWEYPRQTLDTTRNKSQACFWYTLQFSSALFQCCLHRRAGCHLMVLQELSMPPAVPNHCGTMWRYYISFATCGCNVPGWHSKSKFHDNGIAKPREHYFKTLADESGFQSIRISDKILKFVTAHCMYNIRRLNTSGLLGIEECFSEGLTWFDLSHLISALHRYMDSIALWH